MPKVDNNIQVISKANSVTALILLMAPLILILGEILGIFLFGTDLSDSMFYHLFGPFIYVIFFGGLIYAEYEFFKTYINRASYIYSDGEFVKIYAHKKIRISDISKVEIRRHPIFPFSKITIIEKFGYKTNIKSHMLDSSPEEVLKKIDSLRKGFSAI